VLVYHNITPRRIAPYDPNFAALPSAAASKSSACALRVIGATADSA
jgi:hypothetical protein